MKLEDPLAPDVLRMYILLHADHEGGNVSAHLAHVVASAHSDLFYAYGAALCGLAGPLHGLANQQSLKWQLGLKQQLQELKMDVKTTNQEELSKIVLAQCREDFDHGRVIPGFGHAVLRSIDPRYKMMRNWGEKYGKDSDLIRLSNLCADEVSKFLRTHKKIACPYPNIDCGSGALLYHIVLLSWSFIPYYLVLPEHWA